MSRYLLDTNAAADCIFRRRGGSRARPRRPSCRSQDRNRDPRPRRTVLFAGIEYSATRDANMDILNRNISLFRQWPFTTQAAREYGRLYAQLRRAGRTIQTVDLMIAAIALTLGGCTVVTADSDLSAVSGLNVENWATG